MKRRRAWSPVARSLFAYSLFGLLIQRPCDIQAIDALHGSDG